MSKVSDHNNDKTFLKGMKQHWVIVCALIAIFIGLLAFVFNLGGRDATAENEHLSQVNQSLRESVNATEVERQQYLRDMAILASTKNVDKLALENTRVLIRNLEEDKARLEKELAFYRSIIAPEDAATGVRVQTLELHENPQLGEFHFRIVVSQVSRSNAFLKGHITIDIEGAEGGKERSLSLFQLAGNEKASLPLGFRYFQALPENPDLYTFTLPEGFVPKQIRVSIKIQRGAAQQLNEVYNWEKTLATETHALLE